MKNFFVKIIELITLSFTLTSSVYAYTDPYLCAKYDKLKLNNIDKVLEVGIRKVFNLKVETYVIGFGTPIYASFNHTVLGESRILKRRALQCKGFTIGHVRFYDLSNFSGTTGRFELKSGDKEVSTYIEVD